MRILIEVNSNIGDLVMNLPILNYFNNNFTELSIDVIADKKSANLLSETSYIKNIYIKEKKNKEKFKLFFKLSKFKYDLAIGLRSDAVPLVIRASKKLYKNDRDKKLLNKCSETLYHYSILKKYFEYNEKLIDTHIDFNVKTLEYAKKLVDYKENDEILFIGPGANAEEKIWPKENYIELINLIKSKFNKIVIVGAPDEYDLCEEVSIKTSSINLAKKNKLGSNFSIIVIR